MFVKSVPYSIVSSLNDNIIRQHENIILENSIHEKDVFLKDRQIPQHQKL